MMCTGPLSAVGFDHLIVKMSSSIGHEHFRGGEAIENCG